MTKFTKEHLSIVIGVLAGAVAGYFYWQQAGCSSGSCVISSNPIYSTIYGAVMGGILLSIFQNDNKKTI